MDLIQIKARKMAVSQQMAKLATGTKGNDQALVSIFLTYVAPAVDQTRLLRLSDEVETEVKNIQREFWQKAETLGEKSRVESRLAPYGMRPY